MSIFLKHLFEAQNQFASGGLILMLVGAIGVFLRDLPKRIFALLVSQSTLMITVKDDDAAFQWVKEWFLEQSFLKRIRRVDLDTTLRGTELALIPAPGRHIFWYEGRLFWVIFSRSGETKGRSQRRIESLTFQTIGRKQLVLRRFVNEIVACHHRKAHLNSSLYMYDEYWTSVEAYSPRFIDSIILKPNEKQLLMRDLENFRSSRERYRALGVPYHRGYLFHGPPGTGKTSLVSGLAAKYGMSIYLINLTELNDRSLKIAMNNVPENAVILFEDIDCMRLGTRKPNFPGVVETKTQLEETPKIQGESNFQVTLSGLLNVLDGFHAPENVIFVMTTNDKDSLDPALLRPGRIDYKLLMGEADETQKSELYRRFFPGTPPSEALHFASTHKAKTMAEFQGLLLQIANTNLLAPALDPASHRRGQAAHHELTPSAF